MFRRTVLALFLIATFIPLSFSVHGLRAQGTDDSAAKLPEGKGKDLVVKACQQCHGLELTTDARKTLDEWKDAVNRMVNNGAELKEDEAETVSQYLAKNFGSGDSSEQSKEGK